MNYYNDFDKKACAWLRELIKAKRIPDGIIDERSITDVKADDLRGFTQCHFFAGIGGWSRALQIAGWPEEKPVWTGSCPCQPFSTAGKQEGKSDERHLWPAFARLIAECKPPVVFGEQVESAIKHGWIDDLQADLEREDYAVGFAVLGAHSVGAPHIRQRLYWVANAELHGHPAAENRGSIRKKQEEGGLLQSEGACDADRVANSRLLGSSWPWKQTAGGEKHCGIGGLADSSKPGLERLPWDGDRIYAQGREHKIEAGHVAEGGEFSRVANADRNGLQPRERNNSTTGHRDTITAAGCNDRQGSTCQAETGWNNPDWLFCRDGKWRPVESGTFPLANGIPGRVGLLRGYGNAIVPQVAAEFIRAFMGVSQ
jgi:DNA (cytosine-5)-methyltransferase 1